MHAYGSVYGITGRVVAEVNARNAENLRLLANEGKREGGSVLLPKFILREEALY
jgi:hypothetical protein